MHQNFFKSFLSKIELKNCSANNFLKIKRNTDGFKSPFIQYVYISFSISVLLFIVYDKPFESFIGLGILVIGALTYLLSS